MKSIRTTRLQSKARGRWDKGAEEGTDALSPVSGLPFPTNHSAWHGLPVLPERHASWLRLQAGDQRGERPGGLQRSENVLDVLWATSIPDENHVVTAPGYLLCDSSRMYKRETHNFHCHLTNFLEHQSLQIASLCLLSIRVDARCEGVLTPRRWDAPLTADVASCSSARPNQLHAPPGADMAPTFEAA